jgi:hypothetical protein
MRVAHLRLVRPVRTSESDRLIESTYLVCLLVSCCTFFILLVLLYIRLQGGGCLSRSGGPQRANEQKRTAFSASDNSFHLEPMILAS